MAKDRMEARIVERDRADGKVEVSMYDPSTGREIRTGLTHDGTVRGQQDTVGKLAKQFEQAGNRVGHVHIRGPNDGRRR